MFNRIGFVLGLTMLMGACTREVYLQPVTCFECEQNEAKCSDLTPECCPELAMETKTILFEVYDRPATSSGYRPCEETSKGNCRTVCRQKLVEAPVAE